MTATTQAATTDLLQQYGEVIHLALLIRKTEQRLLELFKQGKLFGTIHTCIGQEFVGVAVARALQPQDNIFSNHRCHGHFLAYRRNLVGLIGEVMGKSVGVCGGRGGSQHLHQENFFSNGVQGSIAPVSTGLAYGQKVRGTNGITVVYVGDGTLGEGVLYESMNIASKWEVPLLLVCENNLYAQSTNQSQTLAGSIRGRAEAFGIETAHSDTWHWPELLDSIAESARLVRSTSKPRFHQVDTYRLMAHSKGDDNRPESEVAPYWDRDPLVLLTEQYASDARFQQMSGEIEQLIDQAVAEAEAAPFSNENLLCCKRRSGCGPVGAALVSERTRRGFRAPRPGGRTGGARRGCLDRRGHRIALWRSVQVHHGSERALSRGGCAILRSAKPRSRVSPMGWPYPN